MLRLILLMMPWLVTAFKETFTGLRFYAANNLDADNNLSTMARGGAIKEDIMNKIWQIDGFALPFTDMCSTLRSTSNLKEWTTDELGDPATDNAKIDGQDSDQNDADLGERRANYHQISTKEVRVSKRANAVNSVGNMGTLSYQVAKNQKRLRRDVEAQMLTHQASVAGNGTDTASVSAGLGAQISTNVITGTTGSAGGFNTSTGVFDAPTPGTALPVTEQGIRDIAQAVYEAGGNTTHIMGTPQVIRLISAYLFSSAATVAQMNNMDTTEGQAMTAYGAANVFITDFGQVLKLTPNRLQQVDAVNESSLYFLDSDHLHQSFITGYQVEPLSKTGLSEKRLMSVDYCLCVGDEAALGSIIAIDQTAAMLAQPA